jgi:hypothetical protein
VQVSVFSGSLADIQGMMQRYDSSLQVLPYLTLPYLTLPYLTLPYLTLPMQRYDSSLQVLPAHPSSTPEHGASR